MQIYRYIIVYIYIHVYAVKRMCVYIFFFRCMIELYVYTHQVVITGLSPQSTVERRTARRVARWSHVFRLPLSRGSFLSNCLLLRLFLKKYPWQKIKSQKIHTPNLSPKYGEFFFLQLFSRMDLIQGVTNISPPWSYGLEGGSLKLTVTG